MIRIVPFLLTLKIKICTALNKEKSSEANGLRGNLANDSNFDRNPLRGCNYGLEGGAFLILGGGSSLPKEEERLHGLMG